MRRFAGRVPCIPYHAQVSFRYKYSTLPPKSSTVAKFDFPPASHTIPQITRDFDTLIGSKASITINGHLHRKPRVRATRSFAEVRDSTGNVAQILMSPETTSTDMFELLKSSGPEDSVSVTGYLQEKQSISGETSSKVWELVVQNYQVLNSSNLDGARLDKLKHSSPQDLPPQFRYLQLRTPFYQNALKIRSRAAKKARDVLINNHGFTEIETPLLFKSTPEGAREFLVPTRSSNKFYALPQSPQQYKQILMSSGFTKYFQLAKCFRDEDLRADRQPEFTQVDIEMSYINNSDQVGVVVEDVVNNVWNGVGEKPLYKVDKDGHMVEVEFEETEVPQTELKFNKVDYIEVLSKYGIDKPDLRSNLEFVDLSSHLKPVKNGTEYPVLEACVLKDAFDPAESYRVPHSLSDAVNYNRRKPIVLAIKTEEDAKNWYSKFVEKNVIKKTESFSSSELENLLSLRPGSIIAFSTRSSFPYENPTPLGKFRQLAIAEFPNKWNRPIRESTGNVSTLFNRDEISVGSWVVNFPLFNPIETSSSTDEFPVYDFESYESTHHPFTMAKTADYDLLATDPLKVRGEHYDLVINGVEVGGGSRRIHDAQLQQYVFEEILRIKNYDQLFGHLLKALSMGCPPHAGLALGFDRMCAMLIGSSSIRDVIAFPKNQSGIDPVVDSPTGVTEKVLHEYYIEEYVPEKKSEL